MRKTVHRLFFIWNFDKEEQWLNEMAAKGLCLISVGFCKYEFEDCLPGEYQICMQLLEKSVKDAESQQYLAFLEQAGAQHIGTFTRWVYFRRRATDGQFALFSDYPSRVKYLTGVLRYIALITGLNLLIGLQNVGFALFLRNPFNYIGFLNLVIGIWGSIGCWGLWKKRKRMKMEANLFE